MKGYPCPEAGGTIGIYPSGKFHRNLRCGRSSVNDTDEGYSLRRAEGHRLSLRTEPDGPPVDHAKTLFCALKFDGHSGGRK